MYTRYIFLPSKMVMLLHAGFFWAVLGPSSHIKKAPVNRLCDGQNWYGSIKSHTVPIILTTCAKNRGIS